MQLPFSPQFPVYQLIVSYGQTVIVSNNKCYYNLSIYE